MCALWGAGCTNRGDWTIRRRSTSAHHQPPNCIESAVKKILGTCSLASAGAMELQSAPGVGSPLLTHGRLDFVNETVCFLKFFKEGRPPGESIWNKSEQVTPNQRFTHPYATVKVATNIWRLEGLSWVLVFIDHHSKVGHLSPPDIEGWLCAQPVSLFPAGPWVHPYLLSR